MKKCTAVETLFVTANTCGSVPFEKRIKAKQGDQRILLK